MGCIYKYANRRSSGIINIFKTANVAECAFSSFYTWSFQHKSSVPFELCEDQCYPETPLLTDRQAGSMGGATDGWMGRWTCGGMKQKPSVEQGEKALLKKETLKV